MKKPKTLNSLTTLIITSAILLFYCPTSFSQTGECIPATQTVKKWVNKYDKNVYNPLQKGSKSFDHGQITFTETIQHDKNQSPVINHCVMDFVKIFNRVEISPFTCLTFKEDSMQYISYKDSLYIINHKNKTILVKDFREALSFFWNNPFLSYYFFWIEMNGHPQKDFTVIKSKDTIFSDFYIPQFNEDEIFENQSGHYQYTFDKKQNLLIQQLYEPCDEWAAKLGFVKREYKLLSHNHIVSICQVFDLIDFMDYQRIK